MRIGAKYSHLNGEEYLLARRPKLWCEVQDVIAAVDVQTREAKVMNAAFRRGFEDLGWKERRNTFWVTEDGRLLRYICGLPAEEQKAAIEAAGHEPIRSGTQTDFMKERIAVEVQFGHHACMAHDLFVKHLSFHVSDIIDVGSKSSP